MNDPSITIPLAAEHRDVLRKEAESRGITLEHYAAEILRLKAVDDSEIQNLTDGAGMDADGG